MNRNITRHITKFMGLFIYGFTITLTWWLFNSSSTAYLIVYRGKSTKCHQEIIHTCNFQYHKSITLRPGWSLREWQREGDTEAGWRKEIQRRCQAKPQREQRSWQWKETKSRESCERSEEQRHTQPSGPERWSWVQTWNESFRCQYTQHRCHRWHKPIHRQQDKSREEEAEEQIWGGWVKKKVFIHLNLCVHFWKIISLTFLPQMTINPSSVLLATRSIP